MPHNPDVLLTPTTLTTVTKRDTTQLCAPSLLGKDAMPTLLTIPYELQRSIFALLLHRNHVNIKEDKYEFEVAILRVNRQLSRVAHELLYDSNDFLIMSDMSEVAVRALRLLRVPVVSTHKVHSIREHRFSLSFGGKPPVVIKTDVLISGEVCDCIIHSAECRWPPISEESTAPSLCILLVARDLDRLCRAFGLFGHCFPLPPNDLVIVSSERGIRPIRTDSYPPTDDEASMTIVVRRNIYDRLGEGKAKKMLEWRSKVEKILQPLYAAAGPRAVYVGGDIDVLTAHRLEVALGPRVVWREAVAWDFYDKLKSWKLDLESLVRTRDNHEPKCSCLAMRGYLFAWAVSQSASLALAARRSHLPSWADAFNSLKIDIAMTFSRLCIEHGNFDGAVEYFHHARTLGRKISDRGHARILASPQQRFEHPYYHAQLMATRGQCLHSFHMMDVLVMQYTSMPNGIATNRLESLHEDWNKMRIHMEIEPHVLVGVCRSVHWIREGWARKGELLTEHVLQTQTPDCRPEGLEGWVDTWERLTWEDLQALGLSPFEVAPCLLTDPSMGIEHNLAFDSAMYMPTGEENLQDSVDSQDCVITTQRET